jgi:hypothetical protein
MHTTFLMLFELVALLPAPAPACCCWLARRLAAALSQAPAQPSPRCRLMPCPSRAAWQQHSPRVWPRQAVALPLWMPRQLPLALVPLPLLSRAAWLSQRLAPPSLLARLWQSPPAVVVPLLGQWLWLMASKPLWHRQSPNKNRPTA